MAIKVVIVEDEPEILEGYVAMFENKAEFELAGIYTSAEQFMNETKSDLADVVVMDLQLPGMSGIECIEKMRAKGSSSQFLVCSVYHDEDHIFQALCAGAVGYLLKNTKPQKFFEAITDVYQGGSPMSAEIARKVVISFGVKKKPNEVNLLTEREKEILTLLSKGYRYKEIADKLFISVKTVRTHIRNIYEKLQVGSRMDAVNKAFGNSF